MYVVMVEAGERWCRAAFSNGSDVEPGCSETLIWLFGRETDVRRRGEAKLIEDQMLGRWCMSAPADIRRLFFLLLLRVKLNCSSTRLLDCARHERLPRLLECCIEGLSQDAKKIQGETRR